MKLILSGEGPSDLGSSVLGECGESFMPGPMAWIVDRLLQAFHTTYSLIENHSAGADCIVYVNETRLASFAKQGSTLLPGIKYGKGNSFYARNAQCLGLFSKSVSARDPDTLLIAVLFRDGDGTNANKQWSQKVESMCRGFELAEFQTGVPMVPNPKSEAWMICALRSPPYTNCASLEEESGNDISKNPLKEQLKSLCGCSNPSAEDQAEWVREGRVNPVLIDRPSFSMFKKRLHLAAQNAGLADLRPIEVGNH